MTEVPTNNESLQHCHSSTRGPLCRLLRCGHPRHQPVRERQRPLAGRVGGLFFHYRLQALRLVRCREDTGPRRQAQNPRYQAQRRQGLPPHPHARALRPPLRGHSRGGPFNRPGISGPVRLSARILMDTNRRGLRRRCPRHDNTCRLRAEERLLSRADGKKRGRPGSRHLCGAGHPIHNNRRSRRIGARGRERPLQEPLGRVHHLLDNPHSLTHGPVPLQVQARQGRRGQRHRRGPAYRGRTRGKVRTFPRVRPR